MGCMTIKQNSFIERRRSINGVEDSPEHNLQIVPPS